MASNCIITSGLALASCVNNVPGLDSLYVLTSTGTSTDAQFASITYDGDGFITTFSAATISRFNFSALANIKLWQETSFFSKSL